jgi:hypothetical protein
LTSRSGQGGQDGVAVEFVLDRQRGVEPRSHAQEFGDRMRLVDAARARAADVQFLESDDVRLVLRDHCGDPGHVQTPVHAKAAMDVVGHDARHGRPLARP